MLPVQNLSSSLHQHYPALRNHFKIFRELYEFSDGDFGNFAKITITHRIKIRIVS